VFWVLVLSSRFVELVNAAVWLRDWLEWRRLLKAVK
jgi:hypothetical protein